MSPWLSDLFLGSQSDERLARLARAGHGQAFTAIVQRYRLELTRFAARLCSQERAEDLVQQTFLSAFAALQGGCEVKHLRGWLYTILRHHAARAGARAGLETELADAALPGVPLEEAVGQRLVALAALSEIKRLPDNQRAALLATALEGRSRAEIASTLGLSEGAVRQLVHRARSTVRAAVTAITPFPLLRWVAVHARTAPAPSVELAAGTGGASAGAVVLKLGAVVVAGLGVAGVAGLRSAHEHRTGRTVRSAPAEPGRASVRSGPGLAGLVTPLRSRSRSESGEKPGPGRAPGSPAGAPGSARSSRGDGGGNGREGPDGGKSSGPGGDSGQAGSSGGLQGPGSGDGGHGGTGGGSGEGGSSGSGSGSSGTGSGSSGTGSGSGTSGAGSGSDGGTMASSGSSGTGTTSGGGPGGGGAEATTATSSATSDGGGSSGGSTGGGSG